VDGRRTRTAGSARPAADQAAARVRGSRAVRVSARVGIAARGLLYLLLGYLASALVAGWRTEGRQANANGALSAVAATPVGLAALVGAALGFACFALARLAGAVSDHDGGPGRRLVASAHALLYLALAGMTTRFVLGGQSTGSEQQHETTVRRLLDQPAGRWLVAAVGLVVVCAAVGQAWLAVRGQFAENLDTARMGPRLRRVARAAGTVGMLARAAALLPIGFLLVVAAYRADPRQAKGLDQLLSDLTRSGPGRAVVWLVAAGFVVFAAYSMLEARYRRVHAGA
jgi:hypothetical protein